MEQSLIIVQHTPWWVFLVLAVLVVTGLQALRPRVVPLWRVLIVPAVFIVWGVTGIAQRAAAAPVLAIDWIVAVAVGFAVGWATTKLDGVLFGAGGSSVQVPGSPVPLVRNAVIFILRYGLAVSVAFAATDAARAQFVFWDVLASGATTGYFLGWLAQFMRARSVQRKNIRS